MLFEKENTNYFFNFLHIPRTAGRFIIRCLYESNSYNPVIHGNIYYKGKEVGHLPIKYDYEIYEEYYEKYPDIKKFTVVRNPVDRFNSAFKQTFKILDISSNEYEDYDDFLFMMNKNKFFIHSINSDQNWQWVSCYKGLKESTTSWFVPQHKFIDDTVNIWKYEDGFGDKFVEWMREENGIKDFQTKKFEAVKSEDFDDLDEIIIPNKILKNAERYYDKDIKLWESI